MSARSELTRLFRALKALAAARASPKLADRARAEDWSYERFAQALLETEHHSREANGGGGRIKAARFPARKTPRNSTSASKLGQTHADPTPRSARLPRRQGERRPARTAWHGKRT